LGFRAWGGEYRVEDSGLMILLLRVKSLGFRVRVEGSVSTGQGWELREEGARRV
jgi:hypothetical protein